MSTQTPERTIADVIEDLNLDDALRDAVPPPVCETRVPSGPCGKLATWLGTATCGHDIYACPGHHDRVERLAADPLAMLSCHRHDSPVEISVTWTAL